MGIEKLNPNIVSQGISTGGQMATNLVGMLTQKNREKRAMQNQRELMALQMKNQGALNRQGHNLQMDAWEKTNYPAQMKMLKEAGLNPGLIYGQQGAGGTTGGQGGGSAASGSAPAPQMPMMDLNVMNSMRTMAEIALLKAQAKKAEAEANVTGSTGIEEAQSRIDKLKAETNNVQVQSTLTEIQTNLARIDESNKQWMIDSQIDKVIQETRKLKLEGDVTQAAMPEIIQEIKGRVIEQQTRIALQEANIQLSKEQISNIANQIFVRNTEVMQGWKGLQQGDEKIRQEQEKIAINKFETEIKANYPSLWNVAGSIAKSGYKTLEKIERELVGIVYKGGTEIPVDKVQ